MLRGIVANFDPEGTAVTFTVGPGRLGRWEAAEVARI